MSVFRFKKFNVVNECSAMKVNTDGVLLGAWMNILETDRLLLDVGTGSGVIALMAAQRIAGYGKEGVVIRGIDIDEGSVADALENFSNSPWSIQSGRGNIGLEARLSPFQEVKERISSEKYDLIFSNPPYFINSLKSTDAAKSGARHTDTLGQGEILRWSEELLAENGRLALILPSAEAGEFVRKTEFLIENKKDGEPKLHLSRLCKVRTLESKPYRRWMMEFVFTNKIPELEQSQLIIQSSGDYTAQYRQLTGDFYLNF